jgi:hypothetical protein
MRLVPGTLGVRKQRDDDIIIDKDDDDDRQVPICLVDRGWY